MITDIIQVFLLIPKDEILAIANDIKLRLTSDKTLIEMKAKKEYVTKADIEIQNFLLNYFANSKLAGTYKIKAEEKLSEADKAKSDGKDKSWQLIIDPLDGTSAFCKGVETWGVMVGACDMAGKLLFSWNLVSSGELYMTNLESTIIGRLSFKEKVKNQIDVYDYGASASERFAKIFEEKSGLTPNQYEQTSYPAAVWAGWQLYQSKLDGLLWLPSSQCKKNYPDYDLIFLGALKQKGYKIRLGKVGSSVEMAVVAPSWSDLENLWQTGLKMITEKKRNELEQEEKLFITGKI
jgi:fructose-1,6-bisphosphatase/inositol monophosphatase family enzyme